MDTSEYLHIASLIRKSFASQLTEEERVELDHWLTNPANALLYKKIVSSENLENTYEAYRHFQVEERWKEFRSTVKFSRPPKKVKLALLRYAAVVIPLMISTFFLYRYSTTPDIQTNLLTGEVIPAIPHGRTKATLILEDGRALSLDKDTLPFLEGVYIRKTHNRPLLSYQGLPENARYAVNRLIVPRGGEYTVELSDGTFVYLNAETEFSYPTHFQGPTREVTLKGEAYFVVSRDTTRPFVVKSAHMNIQVLGTEFNLKTTDENFVAEATLIHGKVQVETAGQAVILQPSWQARLHTRTSQMECSKVNTLPYTAWKDGKFVFNHETMASITKRLEKWYDIDFEFADPKLREITVFGIINRYKEISEVLKLIRSTHSVDFKYKQHKIVVVPYQEP